MCCSPWGHKELDTTEQLNKILSIRVVQMLIVVLDCEFYIIVTRLKHIFINQNRNHCNQHIFANKILVCLFL